MTSLHYKLSFPLCDESNLANMARWQAVGAILRCVIVEKCSLVRCSNSRFWCISNKIKNLEHFYHRWLTTHSPSQNVSLSKCPPTIKVPTPNPLNTFSLNLSHNTSCIPPPVPWQDGPPAGDLGGGSPAAAAASLCGSRGGENPGAAGWPPSPGDGAGQAAAEFLSAVCPRGGAHRSGCLWWSCRSGWEPDVWLTVTDSSDHYEWLTDTWHTAVQRLWMCAFFDLCWAVLPIYSVHLFTL